MKVSEISWIWPQLLWLLFLVPLIVVIFLRHRRQSIVINPANTWLTGFSQSQRLAHLPLVLLLIGLAVLVLASARPQAVLMMPQRVDAVMLVLDTSGSMRADDIAPSRIEAATNAIRKFIDRQPPSMKVGLVSVASTAAVAQVPTTDREALFTALDGIALQRGSALGAGIAVALAAILPPGTVPLSAILNGEYKEAPPSGAAMTIRDSLAIVLLSDGAGNMEPGARKMARLAAREGVRIYTVGIGTPQGTVLRAQGIAIRVKLEEELLKAIAAETSAEYFEAKNLTELHEIYKAIGRNIIFRQHRQTEVTGVLLLFAAIFLGLGSAINLLRSGRVI